MDSRPSLEDLIGVVETLHPGDEPLERLTHAVILSAHLTETADSLIGHFVAASRAGGATWAEIGDRMGVSKQAAQKRFIRPPGRGGFFLTRLTEEARSIVRRAADIAERTGSDHVGTEHLVWSMVGNERAWRAMAGAGGSPERLRPPAEGEPQGDAGATARHIPFGSDAKKVLELALREAIRRDDRRIDVEHILLGILRDGRSSGARLLADAGVTRSAMAEWLGSDPG